MICPYLPRIHNPQRIYCPLDRLHQRHCTCTKFLDQELLFPNPDTVLTGTLTEKVSALPGWRPSDLQVPSSASARSTMRCTRSRTTSSSSSVLKVRRTWKFPGGPKMLSHQPLRTTWHPGITHRLQRGLPQNIICQSARCPPGCRIRAAGAWKWVR